MAQFGDLIEALGELKNVKEKRHAVRTLQNFCTNRSYQVKIVNRGGWRKALLPLIISLDEECRKYAALAVANLTTSPNVHAQLLQEEIIRHLVPILPAEDSPEVVAYVLTALGNLACSPACWPAMSQCNTMEVVVSILNSAFTEDTTVNALFCIANATADPAQRKWLMENEVYNDVWGHLNTKNPEVLELTLTILRGLSVEPEAQQLFPKMGLLNLLMGLFLNPCSHQLKMLTLEIFLHLSFLFTNAPLLLEPGVSACLEGAARPDMNTDFVPLGVAAIANLFENIEMHDKILASPLYTALAEHADSDVAAVQEHVIRALMHLSLSAKYHHVILATGAVGNCCAIGNNHLFPLSMRINALQMMASVCATHPSTPTEEDVLNLCYLACSVDEHLEIRRAAMMVLGNASAESSMNKIMLHKPYIQALVPALGKATDTVLVDYFMMFFHNICKMDARTASLLMECGFYQQTFTYERLESLSSASAVYLCDLLRQLAEDPAGREELMKQMLFHTLTDAWARYIYDEPKIAPHLALMCSAFVHHPDTHEDFALQGGIRLVVDLYANSKVEHVRLCCLHCMLCLAEGGFTQRSLAQEQGIQMLLEAAENETHIDLVANALKALIPFASSDDYRPQLGMDGAIDTFGTYLLSDDVPLQLKQHCIYLLQNALELRANRRIFLNLSDEKNCEEDYLIALVRFMPFVTKGKVEAGQRVRKEKHKGRISQNPDDDKSTITLSPHDPFIVRCAIHCLALLSLEHAAKIHERFLDLGTPALLYNLFNSGQIDRSSGEAVLLFFANILHGTPKVQATILKALDILPVLLSARQMQFAAHTNVRCLSAIVSLARVKDFRRMVMGQLEAIMLNINGNLNSTERDDNFYATAALQCALLCELAQSPEDTHESMVKHGVVEALLMFVTVAGKGLGDELCVELLMGAVHGVATLVASPTCGNVFMRNLVFPPTRLQLFASFLRLPREDIDTYYHSGTVGLRTLQRVSKPGILPDDLYVDSMGRDPFIDLCGVRPADFIYRNVIRTLCMLLADAEMRRFVQQALSTKNIVPTCIFALRGTMDIYVQVYGFLLLACFSCEESLQHALITDTSVVNEVLNACRRFTGDKTDQGPSDSVDFQKAHMAKGRGEWEQKATVRNKFLMAMTMLTNVAELIKERYRLDEAGVQRAQKRGAEIEVTGELSLSNNFYVSQLAARCLWDLSTEELLNAVTISPMQEFQAMLQIVIAHNTLMSRIQLQAVGKGGPVPIPAQVRVPDPKSELSVVEELRPYFKSLHAVHIKTASLLSVVEGCLHGNTSKTLVTGILDFLSGLTFLSPLSIKEPVDIYRLLRDSPPWAHPRLCNLFVNCLSHPQRGIAPDPEKGEEDMLQEAESEHLFPLMTTAGIDIRQFLIGALANIGACAHLWDFLADSGVFRTFQPLHTRAQFAEHFRVVLEKTRLLANVTCRAEAHHVVLERQIGFLSDVLVFSSEFAKGGFPGGSRPPEPEPEYIPVEFTEEDAPPLGLRMRWGNPPYIAEVLENTPASRLERPLMEKDALVDINGIDVTQMHHDKVKNMFGDRPLQLLFRRDPPAGEEGAEKVRGLDNVDQLDMYGSQAEYLECFHLALITVHNLASDRSNHENLLAEPKILNTLIALLPDELMQPSFRRLAFAALTSFAMQRELSKRIYFAMADFFRTCEYPDSALRKYIMLCANLFYTGLGSDEIVPDKGMLDFIMNLSREESQEMANMAMIEILHGMARAPAELRGEFVCRSTMVHCCQYVEVQHQWDVQARAFESAYFMTNGTIIPEVWEQLELMPRMAKAVAKLKETAHGDAQILLRADALWEIALRTASVMMEEPCLRKHVCLIPELERFFVEVFADTDKQPNLVYCAGHVMAQMLQTEIATVAWTRWKAMGIFGKIVQWFRAYNQRQNTRGHHKPNSDYEELAYYGQDLDSIFHMLLFAVGLDASLAQTLVSENIVACFAKRLLAHVELYQRAYEARRRGAMEVDPELLGHTHRSFRCIAQLITILAGSGPGAAILSHQKLELPLLQLLGHPPDDYQVPTMLILCSLAGEKETVRLLAHAPGLEDLLKHLEKDVSVAGGDFQPEDIEYLVCLLDRSCCHPDLAAVARSKFLHLLCIVPIRSDSIDAQLMSLRSLARCSFVDPQMLEDLAFTELDTLHYLMAVNSCLLGKTIKRMDSHTEQKRQAVLASVEANLIGAPGKAPLMHHFSRAVLCGTFWISRIACQKVFLDFDIDGLLDELRFKFDVSYQRIQTGKEKRSMIVGELYNSVVSSLHIYFCILFRQLDKTFESAAVEREDENEDELVGEEPESLPARLSKYALNGTIRLLDVLFRYLELGGLPSGPLAKEVADDLLDDIRVLFYITAILREIASKPRGTVFMRAFRSKEYFQLLGAMIVACLKRQDKITNGPLPRNVCQDERTIKGITTSPLAHHGESFHMSEVFENLVVCLRSTLVQAVYVVEDSDEGDPVHYPWAWKAQPAVEMHKEAFNWLPQVMHLYSAQPGIVMEIMRYICAASVYYDGPAALAARRAAAPSRVGARHGGQQRPGPESGAAEAVEVDLGRAMLDVISLRKSRVVAVLLEVLDSEWEPTLQTLACFSIANFAEYERGLDCQAGIEGMKSLAPALVRALSRALDFPRELAFPCVDYCLRALISMLSYSVCDLTACIMATGAWEGIAAAFRHYYVENTHHISADNTFRDFAMRFSLLLRNWVSAGFRAEMDLVRRKEARRAGGRTPQHELDMAEALACSLNTAQFLNLVIELNGQLADVKKKPIKDRDRTLDALFADTLMSTLTILMRQKDRGRLNWDEVNGNPLEILLKQIQEHRYDKNKVYEDDEVMIVLYMMTQLGFNFGLAHFPGYFMMVAYGEREEHTIMQDVAAVCCAIISTQNSRSASKDSSQVNMANIVKDYAAFIHAAENVPDPIMQLWHYRVIVQWSQRPAVITSVSMDARALGWVVRTTLEKPLQRYSIVFVHNISVLRWPALLALKGSLAQVCDAYRGLAAEEAYAGGEPERNMLKRLLMGIVRNCIRGTLQLEDDLGDGDLAAIVRLVDVVSNSDLPLYMATLLHICHGCSALRLNQHLARHRPLMEMLVQRFIQSTRAVDPGELTVSLGESDLYNIESLQVGLEEGEESQEDEKPVPTSPQRRRQTAHLPGTSGIESPSERKGLGKRSSLYQRQRRAAKTLVADAPAAASQVDPNVTQKPKQRGRPQVSKLDVERQMREYYYFATSEIITHVTFEEDPEPGTVDTGRKPQTPEHAEYADDDEIEPPPDPIKETIDPILVKHQLSEWLGILQHRVNFHESGRQSMSPLYVQVSVKFLWHCMSNSYFKPFFINDENIANFGEMAPCFMAYENEDVQRLATEAALKASLHQHVAVRDFFAKHYTEYPDRAVNFLSHALADGETSLKQRQAVQIMRIFVNLLRDQTLSRAGLRRLAVSLEVALLTNHPASIALLLMQKETGLLVELLVRLHEYSEAAFVRQSMVVILTQTVSFYNGAPALDELVCRIVDLAQPLLEHEFLLFMPVLHRVASVGGRRVHPIIYEAQLHMRLARILEGAVSEVEAAGRAHAGEDADDDDVKEQDDTFGFGPRSRMQWILAFYAVLAGVSNERGETEGGEIHFDSFVCVDLLPVLVRILKQRPEVFESLVALFLMSSVSESPCMSPHVPDVARLANSTFIARTSKDTVEEQMDVRMEEPCWKHMNLPTSLAISKSMRRNLLHFFGNAGHEPESAPALLASVASFKFVSEYQNEPGLFNDRKADLHVKLVCMAQLCVHEENHEELMKNSILDILDETKEELRYEATEQPRDLRLVWLSAIISFAALSPRKILTHPKGIGLLKRAFFFAENILSESQGSTAARGLALALKAQQSLAAAIVPLAQRLDFELLRADYTRFLLAIICSAPIAGLRLTSCEHLSEVLSKGHRPDISGAVLLTTRCAEAFKQMVIGPADDVASACARLMINFVQFCKPAVHAHLLPIVDAAVAMLGHPSSSASRTVTLAELFMALAKDRTAMVIDKLFELHDLTPFLSLARSHGNHRRELVQEWLESFGSSLYDIDTVIETFSVNSQRGLLYLGANSTLEREQAYDLRRTIFALIQTRVVTWRNSFHGVKEYLHEDLMTAMVKMCERQHDLQAACVALFHSFMTNSEKIMLDRIWSGGHFPWLCERLSQKSGAQLAAVQTGRPQRSAAAHGWETHGDLVAMISMALRLIWQMYDLYQMDLCISAVNSESVVKHWKELLTFYCHYPWPLRDSREIDEATDALLILAMRIAAHLSNDVSPELQRKLLLQKIMGLCLTVLLPTPDEIPAMREEVGIMDGADKEIDTKLPMWEAKMYAGAIASGMLVHQEAYRFIRERRMAFYPEAMFLTLHHWRTELVVNQGSVPVLQTVGLIERCAALFTDLLSTVSIEWCIENLGLGHMDVYAGMFLEFWSEHVNPVLKHHSLRIFSAFCQLHPLYASCLADPVKSRWVKDGVHRTFGHWDVRELRHLMRIQVAALAFALGVSVTPEHVNITVNRALECEGCEGLKAKMDGGAAVSANISASKYLILVKYLAQILDWAEKVNDNYARTWASWLALTMVVYQQRDPPNQGGEEVDRDAILVFGTAPGVNVERRARILAEQEAAIRKARGLPKDEGEASFVPAGVPVPRCHIGWLRDSPSLCSNLARMVGNGMVYKWTESLLAASSMYCYGLVELPHFHDPAIHQLQAKPILDLLSVPEKSLNLNALLVIGIVSSYKLQLNVQTLSPDFLHKFHELQEQLIVGIANSGEAPYDLCMTWLHMPAAGVPCYDDFRCLVAFIMGQCVSPPSANAPSLDFEEALTPRRNSQGEEIQPAAPPVAECTPPPQGILNMLAKMTMDEDVALRQAQKDGKGPLYSTILCHMMYALAQIVPHHAQAAAQSKTVRSAAFAQLMKVQSILATNTKPDKLFDPGDGKRAKLFCYVRATACMRAALECITGSWFASDAGAKNALQEEGGRDLVAYLTRHVNQAYNKKTALTRVAGSPWERIMLSQGPTKTIADLLLLVCSSSDDNLSKVGLLGGQAAIANISRYGESTSVRQQATMLLTKLAVLQHDGGSPPG